jgi:hypothetical protein
MTFYPQVKKGTFDTKLQARLNREYDESTKTRFRNEGYNIRPQLEQYRTLEEEKADLIYQYNLARKHLETILKEDVVNAVLQSIDNDRIYTINSYWKPFKESFKGRTNISKDEFIIALDRFEQYLAQNKGTLIEIPLSDETISLLPDALYQKWIDWSERKIDPLTEKLYNINDLIAETGQLVSKSTEELKSEIARQKAISKQYGEIPQFPESVPPEEFRGPMKSGVPVMRGPPPELGMQLKEATAKIARANRINDLFPELGVSVESETKLTPDQSQQIVARLRSEGLVDSLNTKQTRILVRPFGRTLSRKNEIQPLVEEIFTTGGAQPKSELEGEGVKMMPRMRHGRYRRRILHGAGKEDVLNFGESCFMRRSDLVKGKAVLRYKVSGKTVRDCHVEYVSPEFSAMLLDFLSNHNRFNPNMYNVLSEDEKSMFCMMARKARVNIGGAEMIYTPQEKQDQARYRLLLGELDAGNISVIPELRLLVLRLHRLGQISTSEFHRVMYYFFHLFETPVDSKKNIIAVH